MLAPLHTNPDGGPLLPMDVGWTDAKDASFEAIDDEDTLPPWITEEIEELKPKTLVDEAVATWNRPERAAGLLPLLQASLRDAARAVALVVSLLFPVVR